MKVTMKLVLFFICILAAIFACLAISNKQLRVSETIAYAKLLNSQEDRLDYLIEIGQMYLGKKDYAQAKEVSEYIIYNIDGESHEANMILDECREKLERK